MYFYLCYQYFTKIGCCSLLNREAATATVLTTDGRSGSLAGLSIAGFGMGDPLLLRQEFSPRKRDDPLSSRHCGGMSEGLYSKLARPILKENDHVEVPGIFFDFGKSDIKPESEPALKELAAMSCSGCCFPAGRPHRYNHGETCRNSGTRKPNRWQPRS